MKIYHNCRITADVQGWWQILFQLDLITPTHLRGDWNFGLKVILQSIFIAGAITPTLKRPGRKIPENLVFKENWPQMTPNTAKWPRLPLVNMFFLLPMKFLFKWAIPRCSKTSFKKMRRRELFCVGSMCHLRTDICQQEHDQTNLLSYLALHYYAGGGR